jgi:hypothetical protein
MWPNTIGFGVYTFEGIGIVMPVYEITAHKSHFFTTVTAVFITILVMYLIFIQLMLSSHYEELI